MTIKQNVSSFFAIVIAIFMVGFSSASEGQAQADHTEHAEHEEVAREGEHASHDAHAEEKFDVTKTIMEHITDAHEYHLWGGHHDATSIYLPVILIDGGVKTFSSTHFYHGEEAEVTDSENGKTEHYKIGVGPAAGYALLQETVYKLENGELQMTGGAVLNAAPTDLSVTRNVVALLLSFLVVILLMFGAAKFYKSNGAVAPKGLAKFVEPIVLFVRDDIAKDNIGEEKYKKYLPFLLTIFFFIWISNMLGTVPIIGSNLTGNIAVTMFLAICTLLMTVFSGNKNYWMHIFATPGVPKPLLLIMIPIEIVGIFTKPFALMIRLFANITAGHIIILALVSIIFINKSVAWGALSVPMTLFISVLELLVAFLQAYLFAMLSALFIGAAVEDHH
jgi:F-type H+-transporting ATPase subunit a